ncbi:MAG: hypothetical protein SGILL_004245 [Bacillariaceae sp.]
MVHVCLTPEEMIDPSKGALDTLCLVGTLKSFQRDLSWIQQSVLPVALTASHSKKRSDAEPPEKKAKLESSTDDSVNLVTSVLTCMQPAGDSPTSTEVWVPGLLRVVLVMLPKSATVSRHNAPSNPYAVSASLKKYIRPKESTAVVALCEDDTQIKATLCAIARVGGGLLYNRKTGTGHPIGTPTSGTHHSHPASPLLLGGISVSETALPDLNHLRVLFPPSVSSKVDANHEWQSKLGTLALGVQLARRLVDAPCNELDTKAFMEQAKAVVHGLKHVSMNVIRGKDLEAQGYGGLFSVGKAAVEPPALVVMSFVPPEVRDQQSIVLVGKGIVFDTGGLQIKPKPTMPGMKRDMGGAAAVLSAFGAYARTTTSTSMPKRPIHAILCLAENAVASHALRADDIITMYSGKTVEINNTDAEGRLVLSDGCAHAVKHLNPSIIIDMATLTGAQGVATGRFFGALYCNDDSLEDLAQRSGRESGDLCHAMPYAPEFFKMEYQSAVADMKNSVADRTNAQVSCAGQFIGNHISDWLETGGGRWLHIDMAYPSFDKKDERATGFGVGLLYTLLEKLGQE